MIVYEGEYYDAVDTGAAGGRHSVVRKGFGTVLITVRIKDVDERETAIATAMALDEAEKAKNKKGFFAGLFGR